MSRLFEMRNLNVLLSGGRADFSLEDLLAFITGADRLPPLGLPTPISLRFYSQVGD